MKIKTLCFAKQNISLGKGDFKKGFTLVELLIVVSIITAMAAIVIGIINPVSLIARANDATRKKDLDRIKIAFEEYYVDRGYYPNSTLVPKMIDKVNCGSDIFSPWLAKWPCDPKKQTYKIQVETDSSGNIVDKPRWFRVYANLENKKDPIIPSNWYSLPSDYRVGGDFPTTDVNYGVSSPNVSWNEFDINQCNQGCFTNTVYGCKSATECNGTDCYSNPSCNSFCKISCCGSNCN